MSSTLIISDLDDSVKEKLRERAAQHGCSIEAEAREILIRDTLHSASNSNAGELHVGNSKGKFDHLVGIWSGRMTTDQILDITRGE